MTELFLTFPPLSTTSPEGVVTSTGLKSINLLPRSAPETGGRFRVWLYRERSIEEEYEQNCPDSWGAAELIWDRKVSRELFTEQLGRYSSYSCSIGRGRLPRAERVGKSHFRSLTSSLNRA